MGDYSTDDFLGEKGPRYGDVETRCPKCGAEKSIITDEKRLWFVCGTFLENKIWFIGDDCFLNQLEEKDRQIAQLKANLGDMIIINKTRKEQITELREQLAHVEKNEVMFAERNQGLMIKLNDVEVKLMAWREAAQYPLAEAMRLRTGTPTAVGIYIYKHHADRLESLGELQLK